MSRKRSKKVLYEVSSGSRKTRKSGAKLEISKRVKAFSNTVVSRRVDKTREKPKKNIRPSSTKRIIFLLAALIMKIPVKKALVLLVVFAVVVFFWPFGGDSGTVEPDGGTGPDSSKVEGVLPGGSGEPVVETGNSGAGEEIVKVAPPPKDHYIVIASHTDVDQLKALSGHFALNGIKTEFKVSGTRYTLITKDRYLSPGDPQSGIDQAKTNIQEVGSIYKPDFSSGYLRFKFNDIYEDKEE